jgi:hypothetical protein
MGTIQGCRDYVTSIQEKCDRANKIEQIVQDSYCDEDTDAADLALDELMTDDSRSDADIAHAVAMRISFP